MFHNSAPPRRQTAFLARAAIDFGEHLVREVRPVYRRLGLTVPIASSSAFDQIGHNEPISHAEIARRLGHSHQRVGQKLKGLIANALVEGRPDPDDARSKLYELTEEGRRQHQIFQAFKQQAETVFLDLFDEAGCNLLEVMDRYTAAIERKPLWRRFEALAEAPAAGRQQAGAPHD